MRTVIMKKIIILAALLSAFSNIYAKSSQSPIIPSYDNDTRGREAFPQTWEVKVKKKSGEVKIPKLFVFNPAINAWAYYEDGERVMTGGGSGGANYCADIDSSCRTPVGIFRIERKGDADCISHTFPIDTEGGARMPYCMFFTGGYAVHGSNNVPKANVSHGCVRVFPDAARWLSERMDIGTSVLILPY